MNKILINDSELSLIKTDNSIKIDILDSEVKDVVISVLNNTEIEIEYEQQKKIKIKFEVSDNVKVKITEVRSEEKVKIQYTYNLNSYSEVEVIKFYDCEEVKELDIVNLNGVFSKIDYHLKTIAKKQQKYDIIVYHNNLDTISNIVNHGVNIMDGSINFNVTSSVYQNITNCTINQDSRIVTFNDKKCFINPILIIDENDVIANHSAHIGKFDKEAIFYLETRGISYSKAVNLLVKGFLLYKLDDNKKVNNIIDKYWG